MDSRRPRSPRSAPAERSVFSTMLRTPALLSVLVLPVLVVVGWVWQGREAALGAVLGWGLAVLFFAVGMSGLRMVMHGPAQPTLAGALIVYLGQLLLLVAAALVLRDATWLDGRALALSAVVTTVVWQIGQIRGYARSRQLAFPDARPPGAART